MNKRPYFLLLFILPLLGSGQTLVGISCGYNFNLPIHISNGYSPTDVDLKVSRNNIVISAFLTKRTQKKIINFGYEVEYYRIGCTGQQYKGTVDSGKLYNYTFNAHFLNLMIFPEYVFGSKWKFIINTGAYLGILLNVKATGDWKTYGSVPVFSGMINEHNNHYFAHLTLGILVGVGIEYPVSDGIVINLRTNYTIGITRLLNYSFSNAYFTLLNFRMSIGGAFKIPSKKKNTRKTTERFQDFRPHILCQRSSEQ